MKRFCVLWVAAFCLLRLASNSYSQDARMASPMPTPVSLLIIDNPDAVVSGSWNTEASLAGKYGANYLIKSGGEGAASVSFKPNFPIGGRYIISEYHPASPGNTTAAKLSIKHLGGTFKADVNQQINGGQWNTLGTFDIGAGDNFYVMISDSGAADKKVVADAIRFMYSEPLHTPT